MAGARGPSPAAIARAVVRYYHAAKRDLPWRATRDPYAIWVSEIMLQQTRVATVIPYWTRWLARFPSVRALAAAPLDDVLAAWAGLGYYSRARNLHAAAGELMRDGGAMPTTAAELAHVRGIGRYTAGAIASIAYGERTPVVDGNVARLLARLYAIEHDIKGRTGQVALWARASEIVDALPADAAPGDLNQGLIELGATVCTKAQPRCAVCPVADACAAHRAGHEDRFPIVAKRTPEAELPILAHAALWIVDRGELLLARRRADGLFGGLWELPQGPALAPLARRWRARADHSLVAYHEQTLSHRRLRITVFRAHARDRLVDPPDPGYDAVSYRPLRDARALGIAASTAAILRKHEDTPWSSIPKRSPSSTKATTRSSKASRGSATTPAIRTSRTPQSARRRASTSSSTIKRR